MYVKAVCQLCISSISVDFLHRSKCCALNSLISRNKIIVLHMLQYSPRFLKQMFKVCVCVCSKGSSLAPAPPIRTIPYIHCVCLLACDVGVSGEWVLYTYIFYLCYLVIMLSSVEVTDLDDINSGWDVGGAWSVGGIHLIFTV